MNEDEEEADEEEEAIQAAQQPASEADLGSSIEEVDAAIRLVSEGLTHQYVCGLHIACMESSPKLEQGHCHVCACITFVALSHGFEVSVLGSSCVVVWQ